MTRKLILGSRGSALALAQTELTKAALRAIEPRLETELRTITTSGDRGETVPDPGGLKGMFTKEVQEALLSGAVDVAVHSMKDLPGHLPADTRIGAVLERASSADVLVVRNRPWKTVGTSSVRRQHQLRWRWPEIAVEPLRGNVPTRLRKLCESDRLDAIVLARAGLERLGIDPAAEGFEVEDPGLLPAIGQGIVALEARADDVGTLELLARINHAPTWCCARAERELLRLLDGDCRLPVAMRTTLDGETLRAEALLFLPDATAPKRAEASGPAGDPEAIAAQIYRGLAAG